MTKNKSSKKIGMEFEEKIIKSINSGALSWQKGDGSTKDYCLEIKGTNKNGFRITTKILEKLWTEALDSNKLPLLLIVINDAENKSKWNLKVELQREIL